jgi:hypothetical protein
MPIDVKKSDGSCEKALSLPVAREMFGHGQDQLSMRRPVLRPLSIGALAAVFSPDP